MKTFCISDECFDFDLWVLCPAQTRQINSFLLRRFDIEEEDKDDSPFHGFFMEIIGEDSHDKKLSGLIALREWDGGSPKDYDTLSHEVFHAIHWALTNRGLKLNFKSDEAWAYLLGSLVRRIAEKLNKK